MNKSELLRPADTNITHTPRNLSSQDLNLFAGASKSTPTPVKMLTIEGANVLKYQLFTVRPLRFYTSFTNILPISRGTLLKRLLRFFSTVQRITSGIWAIDEWSQEYYHWFADALPRIIAASEVAGVNHPVILPDYYEKRAFVADTLKLLDLRPVYYNRRKRLHVEKLLLPSHTAPVGETNFYYINQLRNKLIANKPAGTRKIYISREKATKRKISNELAVQKVVKSYGYEIHFMEDYSIEKQIDILSGSKSIIALHGAGLTNMIFMPSGSKVLEIRNEGDDRLNCFYYLASNLSHEYYYLTATGNKADSHDVIVNVDICKLENVIVSMEN